MKLEKKKITENVMDFILIPIIYTHTRKGLLDVVFYMFMQINIKLLVWAGRGSGLVVLSF